MAYPFWQLPNIVPVSPVIAIHPPPPHLPLQKDMSWAWIAGIAALLLLVPENEIPEGNSKNRRRTHPGGSSGDTRDLSGIQGSFFKRKGKIIYKLEDGKWIIRQRCQSINNAKAALRILRDWEKQYQAN